MSCIKRKLDDIEDMDKIARTILVEIGAIKYCSCGAIRYETYNLDKEKIYAYATKKLKEKFGKQDEYKTFHNAIDQILTESMDDNYCDKCNID